MLTSHNIEEWKAYYGVKAERIEEAQKVARLEAKAQAMAKEAARR